MKEIFSYLVILLSSVSFGHDVMSNGSCFDVTIGSQASKGMGVTQLYETEYGGICNSNITRWARFKYTAKADGNFVFDSPLGGNNGAIAVFDYSTETCSNLVNSNLGCSYWNGRRISFGRVIVPLFKKQQVLIYVGFNSNSLSPTRSPTFSPSVSLPTKSPTSYPTLSPTVSSPTKSPSPKPSTSPSRPPSLTPTTTRPPTFGPTVLDLSRRLRAPTVDIRDPLNLQIPLVISYFKSENCYDVELGKKKGGSGVRAYPSLRPDLCKVFKDQFYPTIAKPSNFVRFRFLTTKAGEYTFSTEGSYPGLRTSIQLYQGDICKIPRVPVNASTIGCQKGLYYDKKGNEYSQIKMILPANYIIIAFVGYDVNYYENNNIYKGKVNLRITYNI